jgi:hypothetical protein
VTLPPLDPVRRDAGALDVPDLPTAILGWRTWRVGRRAQRRTELVAPLAGITWPARQPMVATCGSQRHAPPGDGCACGLYAVTDPGTLEWGPSDHEVLGVVALWGQILEGARGWRASHAYPRFVVTGPAIPGEQRAALARRYGVPVHRSEVPTRALASVLGADADALRHGEHGEVDALLTARMPDWTDRWEARRRKAEAAAARRPWWSLGWRH